MDDLARVFDWVSRYGPWWGLFMLAAATLPRILPQWIAGMNERRRDTASEKAADWTRLREEIARYSARIEKLEASEERCRRDLADAQGRLAKLEGFVAGQGDVRQAAALAAAEVRAAERKKDKPE